jgi:inorganic phosphate transporter, PiT family
MVGHRKETEREARDVTAVLILVVVTVVVVLVFDFTNGFHDASNIVASVVASNAMTPRQAVVIVGAFHFIGPFLGGTAVANTIGGVVRLDDVGNVPAIATLLCGLVGAIGWNVVTWWKGLPSSSSHALVGGLAGAVTVAVGADHVVWGVSELTADRHLTGVLKVVAALLISPLLGFGLGFVLHRIVRRQMNRTTPAANRRLRRGQFFTSAGLAFAHGANDAQKSMGILTLVLVLGGFIPTFDVPGWVILAAASAITFGTMSGGWKIVKTLGFSIFKLRPLHAFDSQLTSALVIFGASVLGAPVSTTHVVSTSIMGIGMADRPRAVRWGKAREIALTWLITVPGSALLAALVTWPVTAAIGI